MTTAESPQVQQRKRARFIKRFGAGLKTNGLFYLVTVVLVMSLAAIFVAITGISRTSEQSKQLRRLVACQNTYNEINNVRTRELSDANDRERTAEAAADKALFAVVDAAISGDRKGAEEKMKDLKDKLAEQDAARTAANQERKEHPVPPPPTALCGSVS